MKQKLKIIETEKKLFVELPGEVIKKLHITRTTKLTLCCILNDKEFVLTRIRSFGRPANYLEGDNEM